MIENIISKHLRKNTFYLNILFSLKFMRSHDHIVLFFVVFWDSIEEYPRLAWNLMFCVSLLSAGITALYHSPGSHV